MLRAGGKRKSTSPYARNRRRGTAVTRSRSYVNPVTSDAPSNSMSTQEEPCTTTASHGHTVTQEEPSATSQPSSNVTVVPIPTTTLPSTSGTVPIATNVALSAAAPFNPTPLISVTDDVGLHVPQTIKEKIWAKQFIVLSKVLESDADSEKPQNVSIIDGQLVMQPKHNSKKIASVDTWTEAFIVFASIYLARYPSELQDMFKYMKTIRLGASRTPSGAWLEYDRQFRLKMAKHTSMSFGSVDGELWLVYMSNQPTAQQTHPTLKCYDYNFKGSCTRYQCSYLHACTYCHKNHPRIHCWSNPNTSSTNTRPNTPHTSQSNFRPQPFQQYPPRPRPPHPQPTRQRYMGPRYNY
jgi:hypothetical protein